MSAADLRRFGFWPRPGVKQSMVESYFKRMSSTKSPVGSLKISTSLCAYLSQVHSVNRELFSASYVVSKLRFLVGPSAVFREIPLVVMNPVDGRVRRSRAHVLKEVRERVPSFTYRNSSAAIPLVLRRIRVMTTRAHRRPRPVFPRVRHVVLLTSRHRAYP